MPARLGSALRRCSPSALPHRSRAQDFPQYGDELYRPRAAPARQGRDVAAHAGRDGRADAARWRRPRAPTSSTISAPATAGCRSSRRKSSAPQAVGIEYDGDLAALARRNAERAGVAGKVTIIQGDIFKEDFSRATVVTLYLLPDLNQQLRPQLLAMKPGTRVVSHAWDMGEWEPDATAAHRRERSVSLDRSRARRRPVDACGTSADSSRASSRSRSGSSASAARSTLRGNAQPVLGAYVEGEYLGFTFVDLDGGVRSVRARVDGGTLCGIAAFRRHASPRSPGGGDDTILSGQSTSAATATHATDICVPKPVRRALALAGIALGALLAAHAARRRTIRRGR